MSRGAGDLYRLPPRRRAFERQKIDINNEEQSLEKALGRLGFRRGEKPRKLDARIYQLQKQEAQLKYLLGLISERDRLLPLSIHEEENPKLKEIRKKIARAEEIYLKTRQDSEDLLLWPPEKLEP